MHNSFVRPPVGNQGKLMRDALIVLLEKTGETADGRQRRNVDLVADRLVALAIDGNVYAIEEVIDRILGKPIPSTAADDGNSLEAMLEEARISCEKKLDRIIARAASGESDTDSEEGNGTP